MSIGLAQPKIDECNEMLDRSYGVFDDLLNQFIDWVKASDFIGWSRAQLDLLLHYFIDVAIPTLVEKAPDYVKVITFTLLLPLLKKLDEAYLHAA